MNRLVACVLFALVAVASAQWNNQNQNYPNQNYPNQQFPSQFPSPQFPNFPNMNDLCKQPGANCKIDSRFAEESSYSDDKGRTTKFTRVCDDKGCYDRKVTSGSSAISTNFAVISVCAAFIAAKLYLH